MMGFFVIIGFGLVGFVAWAIAGRSTNEAPREYPAMRSSSERS